MTTIIHEKKIQMLRALEIIKKNKMTAACAAVDLAIANGKKPSDCPELIRDVAAAHAAADTMAMVLSILEDA